MARRRSCRESGSDVGRALLDIRDGRLYRQTHTTFEDYCQARWSMRRESADRYVRAAETMAVLNPTGLPVPATESVARELAPLRAEPDHMRDAWTGNIWRTSGEHLGVDPGIPEGTSIRPDLA